MQSICTKLIFCVKGACDNATPFATVFGIMMGGCRARRRADKLRHDAFIINNGNTPYCGSAPRRAPLIEKLFTKESTEMTAYRNRAKMLSDLTKVANKYSDLKSFKSGIDELKNSNLFSAEDIVALPGSGSVAPPPPFIENEFITEKNKLLAEKDIKIKEVARWLRPAPPGSARLFKK